MARHVLKTADGEGFLRAYWDTCADIEKEFGVLVLLGVECTKRRGVLKFRLSAWPPGDVPAVRPIAAYVTEYPTAQVASLEACLYRLALKLDHIITQQRQFPSGKA